MISCLIVNFNCLSYTKSLIADLDSQNFLDYDLLLVDQNSHEAGTVEFLEHMSNLPNVTVVRNSFNKPLNRIWNEFVRDAKGEYCTFLNNDIHIPPNFLNDVNMAFSSDVDISCVIHPTNHPSWQHYTPNKFSMEVLTERTRQGWDFSFRKSDWIVIPEVLDFYCGDDFIFEMIYQNGKRVAMTTSSPIIHWLSRTRKSPLNKVIPNRNPIKDVENYKKLGFKHYLNLLPEFSNVEPTITQLIEDK